MWWIVCFSVSASRFSAVPASRSQKSRREATKSFCSSLSLKSIRGRLRDPLRNGVAGKRQASCWTAVEPLATWNLARVVTAPPLREVTVVGFLKVQVTSFGRTSSTP